MAPIVDPWGGYNQGMANLSNTFTDLANQKRQSNMDAITLRKLALEERIKEAGLADEQAQQGAMLQAYNAPDLQSAYAAKIKTEQQMKRHADFFDHIDKLKKAGASPQFITTWAKSILSKEPDTAAMAPDISFIDDKVIKVVKDFGENQLPDPMQPGKFLPAGKYEVEGQATGDIANPYKFTTVKPFIDKEAMMDKRFEQQTELQDKRQQAADARLNKQLSAADARQARALAAVAARTSKPTDDQTEILARGVIDGTINPDGLSKRGGLQSAVFAKVKEIDPKFDLVSAGANAKFQQNVQIQKSLDILDSITPLLGELKQTHTELGFGNYPIANKAKRVWLEQTGDPRVTAYDNLRNNIILEVTNAMQGSSQMSDARVRMEQENLQKAASPAQMTAAIENIRKVIGARSKAFKENTRGGQSASTGKKPLSAY